METYEQFLHHKIAIAPEQGAIQTQHGTLHSSLFPHQRDMVHWALRQGRGLIAAAFGLGKTAVQCELARIYTEQTGQPFLIICPLGVKHQFQQEDGPRLGQEWCYVRTDEEWDAAAAWTLYLVTNYERVRDGSLNPRQHALSGVSLDEGNVLRSLGNKTTQVFKEVFGGLETKFVCTATPSPNRYRELIYYADWLGVLDKGQVLTRFFQRNPNKAGDLTLMPQHEEAFWLWIASWAFFLTAPGDLGHSDEGYSLPPLQVHYHRLSVDHSRAWNRVDDRGQHPLFLEASASVGTQSQERRATLASRLEKARSLIADSPDDHWILWHHLEDERRAIEQAIPAMATIYGSQGLELREQTILDFTHGRIPLLASKPELSGSGCNLQRHCHKNIFLGVDFRFDDFIQACHRTYRYLQSHPVDIHIIYAESQDKIVDVLKQKWEQHTVLQEKMRSIIREYGLSHAALSQQLSRHMGVTRREVRGTSFTAIQNDCVLECRTMASNSVGLLHTSIPFGNHYEYSTQYEDFGHNTTDGNFFAQMDFLLPELYRILMPGRVAAIHVKDRILYGHQTRSGFLEVEEFSDDTVKAFRKHGFLYQGRRTIVTDVVRENNGTYRLGWSEMCKDASKMGSGLPEYLLLFRKPATLNAQQYADTPVVHNKAAYSRGRWQVDAHALWRSRGEHLLAPEEAVEMDAQYLSRCHTAEQLETPYDHNGHVAICETVDATGHLPKTFMLLPPKVTHCVADMVWDDIVFMRTLNSGQAQKREKHHICPLPLDIVERTIRLYSNPGDMVLDPFAGLFTVPYVCIALGRHGIGIELSAEYWQFGVRYCQEREAERLAPTLFPLTQEEVQGD